MKQFKKLVAIQPVSFLEEGKQQLHQYCEEVFFYDTQPESAEEIVSRIGDADAIFVSYTHIIGSDILSKCPNLKYIGMCCSLYSEASSNVDIAYAREHGITVTGIRDYGDEGVAEYVLMNVIRRLHGEEIVSRIGDADAIFVSYTHIIGSDILSKCPNLKYIGMCCSLYSEASSNVDIAYAREHGITVTGIRDYGDEGVAEYVLMNVIRRLHGEDGSAPLLGEISEISGAKVGLLGLGASAQAVARALKMMGADVRYYRCPLLQQNQKTGN